jgi:deoxyribonuclease-4
VAGQASPASASLTPRIGCHVSIAGGLSQAIPRAIERGCECIQIFTTSPRSWKHQVHQDSEIAAFREGLARHGIVPAVAHAIYLLNPASPDVASREKSAAAISECAEWAARMGLSTVVLHAGHAMGEPEPAALKRVGAVLTLVLKDYPEGLTLSLETTSGGAGSIGGSFDHFAALLNETGGDVRIRVWLDTAHLFEAGYDLRTAPGLERLHSDIARTVGKDRIAGAHANDSKTELGSRVDRHENVGEGLIGDAGFRRILRDPFFRDLPYILETPGFDNKGPDRKNVDKLRYLAGPGGGKPKWLAKPALRQLR